ncbi:MAG TPA: ABC transporter substrate-binding protein [Gemmatimonadaceae bacterium]|nr:ABC transporter substrate-binding protein [Gemmatimonadaceae bacterium]
MTHTDPRRRRDGAGVRARARALAFALLAAGMAACSSSGTPIVIGAAGPWGESYGVSDRQGIELAVAEVNEKGGIHGRRVEIVARDDSANGSRAAAVAQSFVDDRSVVAVVGHVNSGAMVAAARVYDGVLPAVATTASTPALSGISPWVFRVISSDASNGVALARFAAAQGWKRVAILYENDSYGRGLADAFRDSFDGTVVSLDPIDAADQNLEPYLSFYRLRAPDAVFSATTEGASRVLLLEARRQGLRAALLGADGWTGLASDSLADGVYVGAPFTPSDPRPEVRAFVEAYAKRYHARPDAYAALAYDATRAVLQAIAAAGPDRARIRDYLATLDSTEALHGVTGVIRFAPSGDPLGKPYVMTRVHDGALAVVEGS